MTYSGESFCVRIIGLTTSFFFEEVEDSTVSQ